LSELFYLADEQSHFKAVANEAETITFLPFFEEDLIADE